MTNWKKFDDDFFLFIECGFIAVNQGDEDSSLKLFRGAEMLKPDQLLPLVGYGYIHLHKLELKQASDCFQKVLEKEPSNEMASAFLGLCMALSPNLTTKGEVLLEKSASSQDPLIKDLGASALQFIDEFVKKTPGPVINPETPKPKQQKRP
ncbi:MAG: hypothetical protein Q8L98_04535 [Chlamydiales bacterium]|nr:hypothetical protein [Chlamydiales bacterium]